MFIKQKLNLVKAGQNLQIRDMSSKIGTIPSQSAQMDALPIVFILLLIINHISFSFLKLTSKFLLV